VTLVLRLKTKKDRAGNLIICHYASLNLDLSGLIYFVNVVLQIPSAQASPALSALVARTTECLVSSLCHKARPGSAERVLIEFLIKHLCLLRDGIRMNSIDEGNRDQTKNKSHHYDVPCRLLFQRITAFFWKVPTSLA